MELDVCEAPIFTRNDLGERENQVVGGFEWFVTGQELVCFAVTGASCRSKKTGAKCSSHKLGQPEELAMTKHTRVTVVSKDSNFGE